MQPNGFPQAPAGFAHDQFNFNNNTQLRPLPPLPAHLHSAYHQSRSPDLSGPTSAHSILNPPQASGPTPPAQQSSTSQPNSRPQTPYADTTQPGGVADEVVGIEKKRGRQADRADEPGSSRNSPQAGGNESDNNLAKQGKQSKKVKVGARASIACIACRSVATGLELWPSQAGIADAVPRLLLVVLIRKRKVRCSGNWPTVSSVV